MEGNDAKSVHPSQALSAHDAGDYLWGHWIDPNPFPLPLSPATHGGGEGTDK